MCVCVGNSIKNGEGEDSVEENRERDEQAGHVFEAQKWAVEEGI